MRDKVAKAAVSRYPLCFSCAFEYYDRIAMASRPTHPSARRVRSRGAELLLTLVLMAPLHAAFAGSPTDSLASGTSLMDEACQVGRAGWSTVIAPFHWNGTDALKAGATVAATAGAYLLDDEVQRLMARNRSAGLDRVADVAVKYGETGSLVLLTGGIYAVGLIASDRWLRETGLLVGAGLVITTLGTEILKPIVGRARPYTGRGPHFFDPFTLSDDLHSFPSGHTAAAFTLSSVLAARIDNPWATAGLYTLASATAFSRLYTDDHWFSDVIFSALTASAVGRTLVSSFEGDEPPSTGFQLLPSPTGITLVYRF